MPTYRAEFFRDRLEIGEGEEVVAADMAPEPHGEHIALVREARSDTDETYYCGVELSSGDECGREVGSPDATCWQHEE